jgi:hypothetical protein
MRFLNAAALLSLPFFTSAVPLEDVEASKGYKMGVFYVNWVSLRLFQSSERHLT